jgi:hypothetical protein
VTTVTNFDEKHCHKWALLLNERREKLDQALSAIANEDFDEARRLFREVFHGVSAGKHAEPGMAGSLLYHMAMVTKMEKETLFLLEELHADNPSIAEQLERFYSDFASDVHELTKTTLALNVNPHEVISKASLSTTEKIEAFTELTERTQALERTITTKNPDVSERIEDLFKEWSRQIVKMRLRQEYETIKGFLITTELAKTMGLLRLQDAMKRVQQRFGEETVRIALNVTLKVGMCREKLQAIMLSDHFITYTMNMSNLDGRMQFLNCPIFGSHKYIAEKIGVSAEVASLFCAHFCYAHAKAMLNTVLPFTFALWQPQQMASNGICEFYLKLAYSPTASKSEMICATCFILECHSKM